MKAFHGSDDTKQLYLERVRAHAAADEIIHGTYWEKGRGCAIGCTIHSDDHRAYEAELGIPAVLAYLEDRIFEGLPLDRAKRWPEQFLVSIRVGADLSGIWPQFAIWLLADPEHGVIRFADDRTAPIITGIAEWYRGPMSDLDEVSKLRDAASNAADAANASYAAYAAYAADAPYAAYAAARAAYAANASYAAYAAARAAYAANASYAADAAYAAYAAANAAYAAYSAAYDADASYEAACTAQADKLLSLLREGEE